jgi:L-threonylcarbamoyladenylate synthase
MASVVLSVDPNHPSVEALQRATEALRAGGLVVFPTETVYGVAGRADSLDTLTRLREVKDRPADKPFAIHLANQDAVWKYVPEVPGVARRLMRRGWPGPLALVVPLGEQTEQRAEVSAETLAASSHDGQIGFRCPDHPVAAALLGSVDAPVVAASANLAGQAEPTDGVAARDALGDCVDVVVDAGPTRYGKASTIVRAWAQGYEVLRTGVLDERMVARMATSRILFVCTGNTCRSPMAERLARRLLAERFGCPEADLPGRGIVVESAGTAGGGGAATPPAVEAMQARGIDLSDHVSRALTAEMVQAADHVFAMTRGHVQAIVGLSPADEGKVKLIRPDDEVPDPFGGSLEEYETCALALEEALRVRLNEVEL